MLDSLRSFAGSPIGIAVFALLIIGLLFFGLGGFGGTPNVARVGSQEVTQQEFADAYTAELQRYGAFITPTRAFDLQIPQSVVQGLIQFAALRDEASRMGMGLTDEAVAAEIQNYPAFQTDGTFNPAILRSVLITQGLTEQQLIDDFREGMLQEQLYLAVGGDEARLPETYRRILAAYYGELRTIQYAVLTPDLLGEAEVPTDEQIQAYYDEYAAEYQIGEVREAVLLELSPRVLADPAAVTEEEVAAEYGARRVANETREVWLYVFDDRDGVPAAEVAETVAAALEAGQTFDELVAAGDIDPTRLGLVGRNGINDPAIAAAAFALEAGAATIVDGRAGDTLVYVAEISAGDLSPLEEIADEIRQDIAEGRAAGGLAELALQIDETRETGQSLAEVGALLGLPTRIVAFDADGNGATGEPLTELPGGNALVTRVFEADIGSASSPVSLGAPNAAVWFEVTAINEPRQLTLEEVRDRVVEGWLADSDRLRLEILAQSVVGLLESDRPIEEIEAELGVTFLTSDPLARTSTPPDQTTTAALQATFAGQLGYVTTVTNANNDGRVVLKVVDVTTPDYDPAAEPLAEVAATATQIANQLTNTYLYDVGRRIPLSVNMDVVEQIVGVNR